VCSAVVVWKREREREREEPTFRLKKIFAQKINESPQQKKGQNSRRLKKEPKDRSFQIIKVRERNLRRRKTKTLLGL
jgi:hypothetical protein